MNASIQRINKNNKEFIYDKVDNNKRMELLRLLKEEHKSLKEAASILRINYSTAKTIIRVFRKENRIYKKSYLKDIKEKQVYSTSIHSAENENKEEEKTTTNNTNPSVKVNKEELKETKETIFLKHKIERDMHTCNKMLIDVHNQVLVNKNILMNLFFMSNLINKSADMQLMNN